MFRHFNNIETAFRHVRLFTFVVVAACMVVCCFTVFESYRMVGRAQERIYILANGKALEAFSADGRDNIPVEARSHIGTFHHNFFTLDPDDKVIDGNIARALYLADGTARKQYEDLKESNYYANVISGNISQRITLDSISLNLQDYPYRFTYYGKQEIIRPTATVNRNLITEGQLRKVSRSDNNPHGFLIERWRIIENRDLNFQKR